MPDHNHFRSLADNPALVESEGEFSELMKHARDCAECSDALNQSMAVLNMVAEPLKKLGSHLPEAALAQLRAEGFHPLPDACTTVDQWHVTCCAVCRARYQAKASRRRLPSALRWTLASVVLLIATGVVMRYTTSHTAKKAAASNRGAPSPTQAVAPLESGISSPAEQRALSTILEHLPRPARLRPRRTVASVAVPKGSDAAKAMPRAGEPLETTGSDTKGADNYASPPVKKRVAVLDFDYGMVRSDVAAIWGGDRDIGKGIADLLVQKLAADGKISVVERGALHAILDEQHIYGRDFVDATTLAKIGKLLNVDVIVIGSVTKFGRDDESAARRHDFAPGWLGTGVARNRGSKAVCDITVRVVDVSNGTIVAAISGNGTSTRRSSSTIANGGNGSPKMSSADVTNTILGEAISQSVISAGDKLEATTETWQAHRPAISGLVAEISGNRLVLNIGSRDGVRIGDKLEIRRVVRSIKDPTTGQAIRTVVAKVGDAVVTDVDIESATAVFEGLESAKVGDTAKTPD